MKNSIQHFIDFRIINLQEPAKRCITPMQARIYPRPHPDWLHPPGALTISEVYPFHLQDYLWLS